MLMDILLNGHINYLRTYQSPLTFYYCLEESGKTLNSYSTKGYTTNTSQCDISYLLITPD